MKFNIKFTFSLVICFITYCLQTQAENKVSRQESMMEYMNNFFSDSHHPNSLSASPMNPNHLNKHHKTKKNYRFKERVHSHHRSHQDDKAGAAAAAPAAPGAPAAPAAAGAAAATAGAAANASSGNGTDPTPMLSNWFMISSPAFTNTAKFPPVLIANGSQISIHTDPSYFRINDAASAPTNPPPSDHHFFFRLSGLNIYYSATHSDINILGAINVADISSVADSGPGPVPNATSCFTVRDATTTNWKICGYSTNCTKTWICQIKLLLNQTDPSCGPNSDNASNVTIVTQNVTQPIIIIPLPSRMCNEGWNYQKYGDDWECDCHDGMAQSPIDLPTKEEAIDSPVKPFFQYEEVNFKSSVTTIDGQLKQGQSLQLKLIDNVLKIYHNKFGKVVTMDGAVYYAQEIVIHVPAEHTIKGQKYDMEVQIIHYGQSKGDIAKQLILSFLFVKTPGVYNKFIDDLDIFNLPSPINTQMDLTSNLFIPKILYSADSTDLPTMKPFSFYTYQGSLTSPPCTENTIILVASKPIPLGTTAIQLFQEAFRVPDMMDNNGNVIASNWIPASNRNPQPLNGRPVFHYDHEKYCGPDAAPVVDPEVGHYEKVQKTMTKYFYVSNAVPSGLPNAFVVSKKEATGSD